MPNFDVAQPPLPVSAFESWVIAAITRLDVRTEALEHELLGNGQPGRIQRLETSLDERAVVVEKKLAEHTEKDEKQFANVTKWIWMCSGGIAVLVAVLRLVAWFK